MDELYTTLTEQCQELMAAKTLDPDTELVLDSQLNRPVRSDLHLTVHIHNMSRMPPFCDR
ncbi:hypothetical protein CFP56_007558 [Quercus suber]|uniref:Uncharacterized protein n=1 Tax=Quercus suber TaxID=58331 RepID=A0AAW0L7I6_QUESU